MLKVGLTGGIGSGKTTVCRMLEAKSIPVYYADKEAKRLMSFDKSLKKAIKAKFGNHIYHPNGRLHRAALAKEIFNNKAKLQVINDLVHPAVAKDFNRWCRLQNAPYVVEEAALIVESGGYKHMDVLVVVTASMAARIARVMKRDGLERSAVEVRMNAQLSDEEKRVLADYIIYNEALGDLQPQVDKLHSDLLYRANHK